MGRATLIDAESNTERGVDINYPLEDFKEVYGLIKCDLVEIVYLPNNQVMLVDEEGRLKGRPVVNHLASLLANQVIVGDVLVVPSWELR